MAEGSTPNTDTVNVPLAGRKRQLPMMDVEQVAAKRLQETLRWFLRIHKSLSMQIRRNPEYRYGCCPRNIG